MEARRPTAAPPPPPTPDLGVRMRTLAHDMERARQGVLSGRIQPQYHAFLARMLEGRLEAIEAEVMRQTRRNS